MRTAIVLLSLLGFSSPVFAAEKRMDVVDFVVDAKALVGQTVTVAGCRVRGAGSAYMFCESKSSKAFIDRDSLERDALRRAMRECSNYTGGDAQCLVDVTGTVAVFGAGPQLKSASFKWLQ